MDGYCLLVCRAAGADGDEEGGGPPPSFPGFGTSESDAAAVNTFYANWATFTTCRSFAWADLYNPAGAARWGRGRAPWVRAARLRVCLPRLSSGCATPGMPCSSSGNARGPWATPRECPPRGGVVVAGAARFRWFVSSALAEPKRVLSPVQITDANCDTPPPRHVRRRMEDENRKARRAARREYMDMIRELVAFVRKRDKRVVKVQVGSSGHGCVY